MIRRSGLVLTAWLALLLVWAPLPFGSVMPAAETFLHLAVAAAVVIALFALDHLAALRPARRAAAALAGVAVLGYLQACSWPRPLARLVAAEHVAIQDQAARLLGEAQAGAATLTLAPGVSRATALSFLGAALALLAAAVAGRVREQRRVLGGALLTAALFEVFFGAQRWFGRAREIWGTPVESDPTRLRGTFVNSNHLAAYLGIALAVAFAWAWWALRRARWETRMERRLMWAAPPLMAWATLFAGLAFSRSRAGLIAAVVAAAAQGLFLAVAKKRWYLAGAGVVAAVVGVGVVASIGLQEGLGRVLTPARLEAGGDSRLALYGAAWDLFLKFPWLGSGLGTFRDAFPLVQPPGFDDHTFWHAHNDPLELLATAGLVGALLVLYGLGDLARRLYRVLRTGARSEDAAAALAALGALVALAVHEVLDFGLTMPANALTLAVVCGAAVTAARRVEPPAAAPPPPAPP